MQELCCNADIYKQLRLDLHRSPIICNKFELKSILDLYRATDICSQSVLNMYHETDTCRQFMLDLWGSGDIFL